MFKLAVLVSGSGSNLQAIIDAVQQGVLNCKISAVITDNPNAYALKRAEDANIDSYYVPKTEHDELLAILKYEEIDLIVLAGYLSVIPGEIARNYSGRIINIHPSLIPKYCGKGFYGIKVHEAVLEAKETQTGVTVHFVDEGIDTGKVIAQQVVAVLAGDTAQTLSERVLQAEHELLVEVIKTLTEKEQLA